VRSGQRLPAVGQQFGQAVVRVAGDAGQHVTEVLGGVDVVAFAGGDQAEQDRRGRPPPLSEPRNSQLPRPTAIRRNARSLTLLSMSRSPSVVYTV